MSAVTDNDLAALADAARAARERAHAPYSRFRVGAALLDEHGRVHAGCNVENAAYPQSLCAEAVALGALVTAGGTRVLALVVAGDGAETIVPCGGCRQKLSEFAAADTPVLSVDDARVRARHTLGELLPFGFGPAHLRQT
ncbi:MAG TPA: cytidine deaminase [Burkholderiaceae bacterium]